MVTLRPRDSRIAAREAAAIPLPREDTTPPVTKTNLVIVQKVPNGTRGKLKLYLKPANTSSIQLGNTMKTIGRRLTPGTAAAEMWRPYKYFHKYFP